MEAFIRRVETEDDVDPAEISSIISDDGFVSTEDQRSSSSSNLNIHDEVSSTGSAISHSSSMEKMALYKGPELIRRLNVFEEVELNGTVTFECQCEAFPTATSKWFKDDVELEENERIRIENSLDIDGTLRLVITNVRKSDEGAYRCKLENQEGVAATTGYLSVTGANTASPKSEHAISSPPLLRAITEESNTSQDLDDASSTSLMDKILTGEYDINTLPYSQYLELFKKEGGTDRPNDSFDENLLTDNNSGNKTPTSENRITNNDVTNITYDSHISKTGDDDVSALVAMETNGKNESTFLEKMADEKSESELQSLNPLMYGDSTERDGYARVHTGQLYSGIMEEKRLSDENERGFDGKGKGEGVETLDENRLKETVIAGRIGFPSGWEYAHYTSETDDTEEVFDSNLTVPEEKVEGPLEATTTTEPDRVEVLGGPFNVTDLGGGESLPVQDIDSAEENVMKEITEAALLTTDVQQSLMSNEEGKKPDEDKEDDMITGLISSSALPFEIESESSTQSEIPVSVQTTETGREEICSAQKVKDEFVSPPIKDDDATDEEIKKREEDMKKQDEEIKKEEELIEKREEEIKKPEEEIKEQDGEIEKHEELIKKEGIIKTPEEEEMKKRGLLPDMTSVTGGLMSGVTSLMNWGTRPSIPEEEKNEMEGKEGDVSTGKNEATGFKITELVSDLTPTIAKWIPEVPSVTKFLPDLTLQSPEGETLPVPVEVEDIDVTMVAEDAVVEEHLGLDWWIDWFKWPWIFYVLLVLTTTILSSATQMNPALLTIIVALCSLVGFFLLPVHGGLIPK